MTGVIFNLPFFAGRVHPTVKHNKHIQLRKSIVKANDTRMNFLNINDETMLNLDLKKYWVARSKGCV